MRDKLVLRFLGFLETIKYILEQSHGVPPVSVALDHTTFKEEGSCGYSSVKTVRSIEKYDVKREKRLQEAIGHMTGAMTSTVSLVVGEPTQR